MSEEFMRSMIKKAIKIVEETEDRFKLSAFEVILYYLINDNQPFNTSLPDIKEQRENINYDFDYSDEIKNLAKDAGVSPQKLVLLLDTDIKIRNIYPMLNPIEEGNTRTENQRKAMYVFLYQNFVFTNNFKMSSVAIVQVLDKSKMDSRELKNSFRDVDTDKVKLEKRTYRITKGGILEARNLIQELCKKIDG